MPPGQQLIVYSATHANLHMRFFQYDPTREQFETIRQGVIFATEDEPVHSRLALLRSGVFAEIIAKGDIRNPFERNAMFSTVHRTKVMAQSYLEPRGFHSTGVPFWARVAYERMCPNCGAFKLDTKLERERGVCDHCSVTNWRARYPITLHPRP